MAEQEKTEIPVYMEEDFVDLLQSMNTMAEATKAFSKAMLKFGKDMEQLAKVVHEIKSNQRLKVRK